MRANVGVLWFKVRVTGNPTHPREMGTGFNAIDAAYTAMSAVHEVEEKWNADRGQHRYFEDLDHPINFNFGGIAGGDWPSSVPAWREFDVRAATYPRTAAEQAWSELQECLASLGSGPAPIKAVGVKSGFFSEGYVLEPGSEAEAMLERTHAQVFGRELESFTTPGYLDGRVFALYADTPALVCGPVAESIHGFDERVSVESIRRSPRASPCSLPAGAASTRVPGPVRRVRRRRREVPFTLSGLPAAHFTRSSCTEGGLASPP